MRHSMRSWHLISRSYSSQSKRPSRFPKETVSLDHFLQRGKVISLWRTIVRGSREITDEGTRKETLEYAREEFKMNKGVTDLTQIRYLVSKGQETYKSMYRSITDLQ